MRRPSRRRINQALAALAILAAAATPLRAADKAPVDQTIGDIAQPATNGTITVEGIGLVIGLQGTGSDPSPSWQREKLSNEMRRNPELSSKQVDAILASTGTSLVIVRGQIPTGISPTDELDVEVSLPNGSTTTSLAGGFLMLTSLGEVGIASNGPLEGKPLARAYGPVLAGTPADPADLTKGRVLGGGRAFKGIPYIVLINEKHQSGRTAKRLEELINFRFHQREPGGQAGMATAKRDTYLELRVPRLYHQNQIRYLQLIKAIHLNDGNDLAQQRLDRWATQLMSPATAGAAAIRLEALGKNAVPTLKKGLESPSFQVKFFASEALAYLDDPSGVDVLAEAARSHPEFRVFALAALAATDEPAAAVRLRELMAEAEPQVRYGAFAALRTADPGDPALGRTKVLTTPEPVKDPFAFQTTDEPRPSRIKPPVADPFDLYVVACDGPPLLHVTRSRRREIVLFGAGQKLLTPVVLGGTGPLLINASSNDDAIEITRLETAHGRLVEQTMTSSSDLVSVIQTVARMGATYPQIVAILESAQKQSNLDGPLLADALPTQDEKYDQAQILGDDVAKKDPSVATAGAEEAEEPAAKSKRPNLMSRLRDRFQRADKKPAVQAP